MNKKSWFVLVLLISSLFVFNQSTISAPRETEAKATVEQNAEWQAVRGLSDEASLRYREEHQNEPHDAEFLAKRNAAVNLAAEAAALSITTNTNPNDLMAAFLVPNTGITVTNVDFTGDYRAAGLYTDGPEDIDNGIILATGRVTDALPPDNSGQTGTNLREPGCSECNALIPGYTSRDAAIFEITFDAGPACSTISFDFVFGSEEYPEWVGSQYNDVFGAYLNGVQVAFDDIGAPITINGPFFSGSYVQTPPGNGLEYDGSTLKLRTNAAVTAGSTGNTLVLVICDAGDYIYDSGVFLANLEGSGETIPCTGIPPQFDHPPTPDCGDTMYVAVGNLITFAIQASDQGPNYDTVTVTATGIPTGASMSPALPIFGDPVTSTFSWTPVSGQGGYHTITFTATDLAPCFFTEDCQFVIFVDDTAPVITCPADITVECDESTDPSNTGYATATDDNDPNPVITYSDSESAGACPQEKTITRTWTATDNLGNFSTCDQIITVDDSEAPVITCPANLTIECTASTDPSNTGYASATDNCDTNPTVTHTDSQNGDVITRTWTATDDCGNSAQCQQVITIDDTVAPVITCPANLTIECDESTAPANTGSATATDNCDASPSISYTDEETLSKCVACPPCPQEKTITRTWTATDDYANSAQCVQTITVQDITAPVITCPANVTIECDESINPSNTGLATAVDNCDPAPAMTYADTQNGDVITRTWTATDDCGNYAQCQQVITVEDTTDPVITCPANITVECDASTAPANTGTATATDNCDATPAITYADTETSGACAQEKTITRTWTATDDDGNFAQCTQTITVVDNTPPVISCPANIGIECDESLDPSHTGTATATDNCDPAPSITYSDQQHIGSITRTWTATDACGNSAQCQQTITVDDTTNPVITCPADITIECSASTAPANTGSATATDNCDVNPAITYSDSETAGSCPQEKTITRTWTATDDNGNYAQCAQTITVVDTTPPAISCPANITIECDESTAPANTGTATATDNCDPSPAVTYADAQNGRIITRTWTATDDCGNSAQCQQTITLEDTTAPVISCPANATVECDESTAPANTGSATATDNCDGTPTITYADTETAGSCGQEKTITRTWTATDDDLNSAQCMQTITVVDNTAPAVSCPANVTIECDESINPSHTGWATATDNCDPSPVITYGDQQTGGTITRTWTATDDCGNSAQCQQTITVEDSTAPIVTCPADITISCMASTAPGNTGWATATDNCDATPAISYTDAITPGACPQAKSIARTWKAMDDAGNFATCVQTITVVDNTPPVIYGCPADANVECDNIPSAAVVSATDNCDQSPTIYFNETSNLTGCGGYAGTITRTWTATDDCGNSAQCVQVLTVVDSDDPVISCPADITINCDESINPSHTGSATAIDNCDPNPAVTYADSETAGSCAQEKTITRTWTATDGCGNSAQCVQTITVVDNAAPILTGCPADVTVECNNIPGAAAVTATDNCDPSPTVTLNQVNTLTGCGGYTGTITRTWTAVDDCGNSANCTQEITVVDNTAPVISCPANIDLECDESTAPANTGYATATDNCDTNPTVAYADVQNNGTITRTWTATDACGNQSSCVQTITIDDTTPPVITCPGAVTVECGQSTAPSQTGYATATDNCDASPDITYADVLNGVVITRTWTATDDGGNSSQCQQTITIEDTTPPVITCPANTAVECDASTDPGSTGSATATDNCDANPSITYADSEAAGSCAQAKTITRTWTATDGAGNFATCQQIITVQDNTAPVITCPPTATVECNGSMAPASTGSATAVDNCDPAPVISYSDSETPGACAQEKTISRTWTATDACGNQTSCVQTINVVDTTPPMISCPAGKTISCDESDDPANTGTATATDNCDTAPAITYADSEAAGACAQEKTITRTWTATDDCGNSAQCTQTITVIDNVDPVLLGCPGNATVECSNIPAAANVTATDNCDPNPNVAFTETSNMTGCGGYTGTITRTWTATDACGNQSSCMQLLTVVDNVAPVLSCPADINVECDESTDPAHTGYATATDTGCDPAPSVSFSDNAVNGTITRTWTAMDACGNQASCDQIITIEDTTVPVITCPADVTISCTASTNPSNTGIATAADNCDPNPAITYADSETAGSCGQEKTITRTWTATDDAGNIAQCVQVITVIDNTAPVISGPGNKTIQCTASTDPSNTGQATATDNCDPVPAVTYSDTETAGSCPQAKVITRTWTATDDCGNAAQSVQTITVIDNVPPVLAGCPANTTAECDNIPAPAGGITATDLCDPSPVITFNETSNLNGCGGMTGTITRTWTAIDACGNQASCSQVITVVDTTPPTLTNCPGNATVTCGNIPAPPTVTAQDNCSGATVAFAETPNLSACGNYTGTITRTWTATDGCGNQASCTQVLTVVDLTAPVITCPAAITVECNTSVLPSVTGTATATDNCDPNPLITYSDNQVSGACAQAKIITRTWTATDDCGNAASCAQIITVLDTQAPVISGPSGITINCDQSADPAFTGQASAVDNCDPAPSVTYADTETAGTCPQEKTITRTWTATDACNNSAQFVQTIMVQDVIAPVLVGCVEDIMAPCDNIPAPATLTATDNCDPAPVVAFNEVADLTGCGGYTGTITRTWTATDACGNGSSCTQILTVIDAVAPIISTCPGDLTIACLEDLPPCETSGVVATDNCSATVQLACGRTDNGGSGSQSDPLIYTDTFTATDACGNQATCQRTITVQDTEAPTFSGCPGNATVNCDAIPPEATVTASDNCTPALTVVFDADTTYVDGSTHCFERITRTWTAADALGNQGVCTQVITVTDGVAPVITGPGNQTHFWTDGPVTLQVQATDNCCIASEFTYLLGTPPPPGVSAKVAAMPGLNLDPQTGVITYDPGCLHVAGSPYTVVVTVSDCRGNIGQHSFTITVNNTLPTIACPPDIAQWYSYQGEIRETITASDADGDPIDVEVLSTTWFGEPIGVPAGMGIEGAYEFVWDPDWLEEGDWVVTLAVDDGCQQQTCSFDIQVTGKFRLSVSDTCVLPGYNADVFITSTNTLEVGGIDLLLTYDQSGLRFIAAEPWGNELPLWEYFTYRSSAFDNCGGGCPSGLLRIIAIADLPNGTPTPPDEAFHPNGKIVKLTFATTDDRSFIGQCFWLDWAWFDCGDNTLSSKLGDTLFIAQDIDRLLPGENCTEGFEQKDIEPQPSLDFSEGAVCICPPPDDRGDINLNGLANEIADAVLFSNYFIFGPTALGYGIDEYYENRVLATDINDDGVVLTIADLVYLIRILTGDAIPYGESGEGGGARTAPSAETGSAVYLERGGDVARIRADVPVAMGAMALTLKVDGLHVGELEAAAEIAGMTVKSGLAEDGLLRVLIFSMDPKNSIPAGTGELLTIPLAGDGSIELAGADASDREGRVLLVELGRIAAIPEQYELLQNYPNPFNAGTMIRFRLPEAADWRVTIYDVAGRLVREFTGFAEPGTISINWNGKTENGEAVSSGMYFYRMSTSSFAQTKKMVLVK
jgi:hypothetical protein